MPKSKSTDLSRGRDALALAIFVGLCFLVSGVAGVVTADSVGTWYQSLQKPSFNPPNWIFAPVWTALYLMMAIAAWRVWRHEPSKARTWALALFFLQLALNFAWSLIFFGLQQIGFALAEIIALLVAIIATAVVFWRIERLAGALMAPYALWVTVASVLNGALWLLN